MALPKIVERLMMSKKSWTLAIISVFGAEPVMVIPSTKMTCLDGILTVEAENVPDPTFMQTAPDQRPFMGSMQITVNIEDIVHINYWTVSAVQPVEKPGLVGPDGVSPLKVV